MTWGAYKAVSGRSILRQIVSKRRRIHARRSLLVHRSYRVGVDRIQLHIDARDRGP
jgi:hypothetical protein